MRCRRVFLFFVPVFLVVTGLSVWTVAAEGQAHYMPGYGKADLALYLGLEGCELSEEDYRLLFLQTGLAKAGVDGLYEEGCQSCLPVLQERFFAEARVECRHVNLFLRSERLVEKADSLEGEGGETEAAGETGAASRSVGAQWEDFLPVAQDGDILVTFSGHVFGWRSGHAALVVNALEGKTLEAVTYGCNSSVRSVEHWREYPCFALLRLKGITGGQQAQIAEYALEDFVDVPYSLFAFAGSEGEVPKAMGVSEDAVPASTQCAHLVWAVYRHFGYDLDSDGGAVVTPGDIFRSDLLEVVQVYGIAPENITNF